MTKVKYNIKEFKILLSKYKEITLKDIKIYQRKKDIYYYLKDKTGFGNTKTCILCKLGCANCLYAKITNDLFISCITKTYRKMDTALTPLQLYNAIQKRIKVLEAVILIYNEFK